MGSLIQLITAPTLPKDIPDFKSICAGSGLQAKCCLLAIVRKLYSILADTALKPDAT